MNFEEIEEIEDMLDNEFGSDGWYWDNCLIAIPDTAILNDSAKNYPAIGTVCGTDGDFYFNKTIDFEKMEDIAECRKIFYKMKRRFKNGTLTTKEYRELQKDLIRTIDSIKI